MEGLTPPLKCLIEMQSCIQNGESVRSGLVRFLHLAEPKDSFTLTVRSFLFAWEQEQNWRAIIGAQKSSYRRALLEIAASGLGGQSVLTHLESLRTEMIAACDLEIREHLELLPLKMLVPLLLFQFPAFLLLLFGPLLRHLIEELNR